MKKLLFLTALFTSLVIGFTACSDNEPVYSNVGIPVFYSDVTGRISFNQADGCYYFKAMDSENIDLLKIFGDSVYPISKESLRDNSIDIVKYIGRATMEVSSSFQDSIWVRSISLIDSEIN